MTTPARVEVGDRYLQLRALREQIAPDATDQELALFAQVSAHLELDPFADQLVLIGRWDKRLGRKVHRHQVTVAGRRVIAERTGELVGIEGPVWCGPRLPNGDLIWREIWDDDDPPYCARVLVYRSTWEGRAANGTAKWSEFHQTDNQGKLLPLWARMPSHMLGKVAESLALRRAFPDVLNVESIGAYVGPDAVDLAEVIEAGGVDESVADTWDTDPVEDVSDVPAGDRLPADDPGTSSARLEGYPLTGDLIPDRAWWDERARAARIPAFRILARARQVANDLGIDPPDDANGITDPDVVAAVLQWLQDGAPRD